MSISTATAKVKAVSEKQERTLVVENDLYRVAFSNRGAVVKSWQLKRYLDDSKPPRILDVVHPEAAEQTGGWPLAVELDDEQFQAAANTGLYQISTPAAQVNAPANVEFSWSNGHLEITKHFHFDHSYVVRVETSAKVDGAPLHAGFAWLGGFGDLTVANPAPIETVSVFYSENGKLTTVPARKLGGLDQWPHGVWQGGKDWTGIQDRFFAAAFLPANGAVPRSLEIRDWSTWRTVQAEGKEAKEPVPQIATSIAAEPAVQRLYVGPKDYDELKKMNPSLHSLVNFGWLEIIADPLFHALKWIHNYVPNWGNSIVVLTLVLNMVLFPLRISSYRTTLKMQRIAPQMKAIQDRMKKYKMNDPKRAELQKELMALMQREGVNPAGGCIPQLLQFPIWIGLYRALQGTIELRHAPWFGWIRDLSAKDPYYILPILMGLSMYLASKMTPVPASADPQQQAMMKIMPIGMAGMFMVIPYPSGLAVYILTSGLVGVLQQWYLNHRHPMVPGEPPASGKGKKKKS
jgi:YidC/Oxa1 family membrane protein insertase